MNTTTTDEFGAPLLGSSAQPGDLVQILEADADGNALPPATDGTAHPDTPPIGIETGIGAGTPDSLTDAGVFSLVVPRTQINQLEGKKVFLRVFNAPTLDEASFYTDSRVYTIRGNREIVARLGATDTPLDTADDDGDGLINSWERSHRTDPLLADTDGDGMSDWVEINQGTDPTAPVAIEQFIIDGDDLLIRIKTMVGGRYRIEQCSGSLVGDPVFTPMTAEITATAEVHEFRVEGAVAASPDRCYLRAVQLLDEEATP
ncbi:MAG: hypothetical protein AAF492_16660 [Verrucomicrobiota bacterium]